MGQLRKKKTFGIIDIEDEEEAFSYCPRCKKQDHLSILKERLYLPGQEIPRDHSLWRQCHECGQIVPIHEAKKVNYKTLSRLQVTHLIKENQL